MKLKLRDRLLFVETTLVHRRRSITLADVVVDTGSAAIDRLIVGEFVLDDFTIQIGSMDYGPDLDGIIGLDFLLRVGAVIDLARLELRRDL